MKMKICCATFQQINVNVIWYPKITHTDTARPCSHGMAACIYASMRRLHATVDGCDFIHFSTMHFWQFVTKLKKVAFILLTDICLYHCDFVRHFSFIGVLYWQLTNFVHTTERATFGLVHRPRRTAHVFPASNIDQ